MKEQDVIYKNIDAEMHIISGLINNGVDANNELYIQVTESIEEEDFTAKTTLNAIKVIHHMMEGELSVDYASFYAHAKQMKFLNINKDFINNLKTFQPTIGQLKAHIQTVKNCTVNRKIKNVSAQALEIAEESGDPTVKITSLNNLLDVFDDAGAEVKEKDTQNMLGSWLEEMERRQNSDNQLAGMTTGLSELDNLTGGLEDGWLVIVAGRPGMGKTAFSLKLSNSISDIEGKDVLFYSLEMDDKELMDRQVCEASRIPLHKIKHPKEITPNEWPAISAATVHIQQNRKIHVYDESDLSLDKFILHAKSFARKNDLGAIVVDYLQLMSGFKNKKYKQRVDEVTDISKEMKKLARQLKVPVIALAQLNRDLEKRPNKRPLPSDLRESGSLEQDANLIVFLYRDEVYNPDSEHKGLAEVIVGKNRSGPIGTAMTRCELEYMSFSDYDVSQMNDDPYGYSGQYGNNAPISSKKGSGVGFN